MMVAPRATRAQHAAPLRLHVALNPHGSSVLDPCGAKHRHGGHPAGDTGAARGTPACSPPPHPPVLPLAPAGSGGDGAGGGGAGGGEPADDALVGGEARGRPPRGNLVEQEWQHPANRCEGRLPREARLDRAQRLAEPTEATREPTAPPRVNVEQRPPLTHGNDTSSISPTRPVPGVPFTGLSAPSPARPPPPAPRKASPGSPASPGEA